MFVLAGAAALAACSFPEPTPTATPKAEPLSSAGSPAAENAAKALSALVGAISPERPLVLVQEVFQKGGYKTTPCDYGSSRAPDYIAVYSERVMSKTVFTPDAAGVLASVTEGIASADGTPPALISLPDDSVVNVPVEDWPDLCPDEGVFEPEYETNLGEWLEAQVEATLNAEAGAYTYAGRFLLDGQPSIRYERRTRVSLHVLEFIEANPLLVQETDYTVLDDGSLVLESQKTVVSVSAGE